MPRLYSPFEKRQSDFNVEPHSTQSTGRSPGSPADVLNTSQVLFAGLSVIIGFLALVVAVVRLQQHRKHRLLQDKDLVFELEECNVQLLCRNS
jgi:hypothetical protein